MRCRAALTALLALALVGTVTFAPPALAQYPDPSRRITFIVPFSAGGSNDILATPEIVAFMAREGGEPTPSTPDTLGRHIDDELKRWNDLVARANLKAE